MLIPTPSRILVARHPVDFRKQIDGLAAVCEQVLKEEPLDGTLFIFRNRRGNALKALVWTFGGFSLVYKKLERTSSPCPLPPKSIGGSSRVFLKTQAVEGSCEEIVGCW